MDMIREILFAIAIIGTLYYVLSTLALTVHFRQKLRLAGVTPKISILKPVCGIDANIENNFTTYLTQDYPYYEVLFGVLDQSDSALPFLNRMAAEFPNTSAIAGSAIAGHNNKVSILHNLAKSATGEILVITDADTRVTPDFLKCITAPFEDDSVGVVTCFYRGVTPHTLADAIEGLHMTCVFAPGVACSRFLRMIDFALGAATAIRKSTLLEIGGFEAIKDHLADDFQLGHRAANAGYRVVLAPLVVDIALSGAGFRQVLARELRWSRTTRTSRSWGHFGLIASFGFAYALLYALATGFSPIGIGILATTISVRFVSAYAGCRCLGDRELLRRLYLLPIRDILSFFIWIIGYFSRNVTWHGRRLNLSNDGRIIAAEDIT
jgi:ceramide glucosyltransferase